MIRRTTLAAEASDLEILEAEAKMRHISLAKVLREVVAEAAAHRRSNRPRPHFGIFEGSGEAVAQLSADDEASPVRGQLRF